ncbi:MAG: ABC transporter permease subunit [Acidimicrobiaceae bacterium]|nr:ABC transporter permease subunit [Acidimicrobiaceae bacterium]
MTAVDPDAGVGVLQEQQPARGRPARRAGGRRANLALRIALPVLVALALIGVWEIVAVTAFSGRAYLLPDPPAVARAINENISLLLRATWNTFVESGEGFLVGIVVGVVLAVVMSLSRVVGDALYPVAVVFQTVPIIAIAPILVLVLHYGRPAIITIVAIVTFFPILSNTLSGLRSTDSNHAELFQLYRASLVKTLWNLKFPQALPSAFAGLRIAAGLAVVGATVGEFLIGETGGRPGLGVLLVTTQSELKTSLLFGAAVFATALAVLFFLVVNRIARLVLGRWSNE